MFLSLARVFFALLLLIIIAGCHLHANVDVEPVPSTLEMKP